MIKKLEQRQIHNSKQEGELIYNKTTKQLVLFNNGEFNKVLLDGDAPTVDLSSKQDSLVSGTNIKTINGNSLLGSGNITISGGGIAQNYSTFEQALRNSDGTPLFWIDGKQIYQKSIVGEVTSSQFLSFGLSDIDTLINSFGTAKNTSINSPNFNLVFVGVSKTSVQIQADSSPLGLYNITIQYTKL